MIVSPFPVPPASNSTSASSRSVLFFFAFFVQFLRPDSPRPLGDFLVLASTMQVLGMIYLGAVFVGFGVKLAATSL